MEKVNYPKGLIRYTSERGILEKLTDSQVRKRLFRPRVLIYTTLMAIIIAVFFGSLATRETLRVDIIRDRGALGREVAGGLIENVYRLQILNASEETLKLSITAQGLPDLHVLSGGGGKQPAVDIEVPATANLLLPVVVQAPYDAAETGSHPITFITQSKSESGRQTEVREASSFIFPR
jgi:polyferredoxin